MTSSEIRAKVRCGACRGPLSETLNLVELRRKATWEYPTSGNVLTGEKGLAIAIVCDACVEGNRAIAEAVEFNEAGGVYHPVEGLEAVPLVVIDTYEPRPDDGCHAGKDGDCTWASCPQTRDGEPEKTGRHCPLDDGVDPYE